MGTDISAAHQCHQRPRVLRHSLFTFLVKLLSCVMYHVGVLSCKRICVAVPTRAGVGLGVAVFARAARPAGPIKYRQSGLMWGSRKPGGGRGSGTPGDEHLDGLARGRPEVGAHLPGAVLGVDPHCPGAGRLTFVPGFNVFCPLVRRHNWNCHALSSRAHQVHGVWSYESTSMEDLVGYSCDVCKVRECVCQPWGSTPRGRNSHGRRPARGRPGVGPHSLVPRVARVDIHCESPGVPDPLSPPGFRDPHIRGQQSLSQLSLPSFVPRCPKST